MKKALFGNDTPEQRELKLKHLEEQIKQTEQELAQINEETKWVPETEYRIPQVLSLGILKQFLVCR